MAVASDEINRALRLLGVLAEGETPSASMSSDALLALNQMIDSWDTERLSVFCTQEQIATWPANNATETIGPTGTLGVMNRPVRLLDSTFFRDPGTGISYTIALVNQEQYNSISLKTITSTYPQVMFFNPTNPNGTLTTFPVASKALEFHFVSVLELAQPATLTTTLVVPDGYLRAFTYNLACELAPEFGVEPSERVVRIATESKKDIKRMNDPGDLMSMPGFLIARQGAYNILAGP